MKSGLKIDEAFIRRVPTEHLHTGMTTVVNGKIDETLVSSLSSGACHGFHFRTQNKRDVCYLNSGVVYVVNTEALRQYQEFKLAALNQIMNNISDHALSDVELQVATDFKAAIQQDMMGT